MKRIALALLLSPPALALEDMVSTRALSMGEALRAAGTGAAAAYLNPAGMPSVTQYVVEAEYQTRPNDSTHMVGVSIVDSLTSPLAAGVYYSFITSEPLIAGESFDTSAHEVGLALAYPLGDFLSIGVTPLKYLSMDGVTVGGDDVDASQFSLDAGAVVRIAGLSLGAAGVNLVNDPPLVRRQLGLGAGYGLGDFLLLEFDARLDFDRREDVSPRYGGGGELFLGGALALRGGAVHEAKEDATFVTGGVGYVTGAAALEAGVRQQVDAGSETLISFALRIFAD